MTDEKIVYLRDEFSTLEKNPQILKFLEKVSNETSPKLEDEIYGYEDEHSYSIRWSNRFKKYIATSNSHPLSFYVSENPKRALTGLKEHLRGKFRREEWKV